MKITAHVETLNCNRCDKPFVTPLDGVAEDYHRGMSRVSYPLMACPHCGMFDNHYIYQRENRNIEVIQIER